MRNQDMTVKVQTMVATPKVTWGTTSTLGTVMAVIGAVGAAVAAAKANDTATVTSAVGGALMGLTVLLGRYGQSLVAVRHTVQGARPLIDAALDGIGGPVEDPEAEAAHADVAALPSDAEEYAAPDEEDALAGEPEPWQAEVAERIAPEDRAGS